MDMAISAHKEILFTFLLRLRHLKKDLHVYWLKLAWESTNAVSCQFQKQRNHTGRGGELLKAGTEMQTAQR